MAPHEQASCSSSAPAATATLATQIDVRQFCAHDHAAVLALFQEGMLAYDDHRTNPGSLAYIQRSIETDLADIHQSFIAPGGNFWVATMTASPIDSIDKQLRSQVVGMIALEKKSDSVGELRRMSVKHEARRLGVGRLLVTHLESWARANGFEHVTLSTGDVMQAAQAFYRSVGFSQRETIVVSREPYYADVLFTKTL